MGTRRVLWVLLLVIAAAMWFFPSDVQELVAKERDILLGRYSVDRFSTFFILTLILLCTALGVARPSRLPGRQQVFRAIALTIAIVVPLILADAVWRRLRKARYVDDATHTLDRWPSGRVQDVVRHRPANQRFDIRYVDQPEGAYRYPREAQGYPPVEITLTTDARGFRNPEGIESCEILAVGDSFTEGSRVDDSESWPAVLTKRTGRRVYNLGVSASSPRHYVTAVREIGLRLSPRIVVCMLYGGNDFRPWGSRREEEQVAGGLSALVDSSPIRGAMKRAMINGLGAMNTDAIPGACPDLAWLPVDVAGRSYTFPAKRLTALFVTREQLLRSQGWKDGTSSVGELIALCREKELRLILVYAPSTPQVVLPLAAESVPAEGLRRFCAYEKDGLPAASEFKASLLKVMDVHEECFAAFCAEQGVQVVTLTAALRDAAARGEQMYYTYDQHLTALGQRVVAGEIEKALGEPVDRPRN